MGINITPCYRSKQSIAPFVTIRKNGNKHRPQFSTTEYVHTTYFLTYPKFRYCSTNGNMPSIFDSQQLLSGFNGKISRVLARGLYEKTMLTLIDVFRFFHNSKHGLINFERQRRLVPIWYVQLKANSSLNTWILLQNITRSTLKVLKNTKLCPNCWLCMCWSLMHYNHVC